MPIYEYICKKCDENFSLLQQIGVAEKDTVCPKCGSIDVKKKFSSFSCSCSDNLGFSPSRRIPGKTGGY